MLNHYTCNAECMAQTTHTRCVIADGDASTCMKDALTVLVLHTAPKRQHQSYQQLRRVTIELSHRHIRTAVLTSASFLIKHSILLCVSLCTVTAQLAHNSTSLYNECTPALFISCISYYIYGCCHFESVMLHLFAGTKTPPVCCTGED